MRPSLQEAQVGPDTPVVHTDKGQLTDTIEQADRETATSMRNAGSPSFLAWLTPTDKMCRTVKSQIEIGVIIIISRLLKHIQYYSYLPFMSPCKRTSVSPEL